MSRGVRAPDYRRNDWSSSGTRLVAQILIRRRRKCQAVRLHTTGHCKECGVHQ